MKKICSLSIIISGGVYQKTQKEMASNSTHACQIKWTETYCQIHLDLFTSAKNWVNPGFWQKTGFSGGVKPGFTFQCPSKLRFTHKQREISRVGRYSEILFLIPSASRTHKFVGLFPKTPAVPSKVPFPGHNGAARRSRFADADFVNFGCCCISVAQRP